MRRCSRDVHNGFAHHSVPFGKGGWSNGLVVFDARQPWSASSLEDRAVGDRDLDAERPEPPCPGMSTSLQPQDDDDLEQLPGIVAAHTAANGNGTDCNLSQNG